MNVYGKRLMRGLLFITILILLLAAVSLIFLPKDNRAENGIREPLVYGILAEPKRTIDVLVIGDSLAECAVSPIRLWEATGITAYDCSTGNQKLPQTEEYLKMVFKNQQPKLVMLEVNAVYSIFTKTEFVTNKLERILPVIRYHDRWKQLSLRDLGTSDYTNRRYEKGFHIRLTTEAANVWDYMRYTEERAPIRQESRYYVRRIRDFCRENGAELLLFSAPSLSNWGYDRHNGVADLAEELGLQYIDMNLMTAEIPIDWTQDTRDWGNHMNTRGAEKVTDWVCGYLRDSGRFADKRGMTEYAHWEQDRAAFYQEVAAMEAELKQS